MNCRWNICTMQSRKTRKMAYAILFFPPSLSLKYFEAFVNAILLLYFQFEKSSDEARYSSSVVDIFSSLVQVHNIILLFNMIFSLLFSEILKLSFHFALLRDKFACVNRFLLNKVNVCRKLLFFCCRAWISSRNWIVLQRLSKCG